MQPASQVKLLLQIVELEKDYLQLARLNFVNVMCMYTALNGLKLNGWIDE